MSERSFFIGDKNEHGLYRLTMRTKTCRNNVLTEFDDKIADLTPEELQSIEEQAHQRRAEAE